MSYFDFIRAYAKNGRAQTREYGIYEKSLNEIDGALLFMVRDGNEDFIITSKDLGFTAEPHRDCDDVYFKAALTHENACVLRRLLPFCAPRAVLRERRSFGVGDRLGIAAEGHIRLFEEYDAYPVLAQQSIRELTLTSRTYEDVLDCVSFAALKTGYKKGFGADADHLKKAQDVQAALKIGYTMITLDCSDYIKNEPVAMDGASLLNTALPGELENEYIGKIFEIEGIKLIYDKTELARCYLIYAQAVGFAAGIYERFFKNDTNQADFEISIDETMTPTTPLQHFFVANELIRRGVKFATIAPRFCGEFQKGIDYIGDLAQFEAELEAHAAIARHFGYKISLHSGSDKFSVFPIFAKLTRGNFHVKTAGTNWLEAMRTVARVDPGLYREIHKFALEQAFDKARQYYHVTTDLTKIPDISGMEDSQLAELFENNDSRQLIHITYGLILADTEHNFKRRLYELWTKHAGEYSDALYAHIGKHLELLSVNK